MTDENKTELKKFFMEYITKNLAGFARSNRGVIRISWGWYGRKYGIEVYIWCGEYGTNETSKKLLGENEFDNSLYKVIGDVLLDASRDVHSEFPRTVSHAKHEYWVKRKDMPYPYNQEVSYQYVDVITYENKPCREFNELNAYLRKRYHRELGVHELYRIALFGKRGNYAESGNKSYLCHCPTSCKTILVLLKKLDLNIIGVGNDDDIDTEYSMRYETECYGTRTKCLKADNGRLIWW